MQYPAKPELLLPAGDLSKLKFAFAYGADAVYAGVPIFSLRARENDFSLKSIEEAVRTTRELGKRIYLTMNIYAHNSKVNRFLDAFSAAAELNPDGFIMTDAGLIKQALKLRPTSVIHLSTQANATNWTAVEFWRDLGLKRIILSRELSIAEIDEIHERVPDIELEAFVHGSVCIAYSGRCLISNYMNHRDANQGTCTNSCRWDYALGVEKGSLVQIEREQKHAEPEYLPLVGSYYLSEAKRSEAGFLKHKLEIDEDEYGTYLMNSKDLCAIELLDGLRNAGVCSFKVEGRSKSVYYLAVVSRAYRRAVDDLAAGRPFNPDNLREAASAANRTLMTGFLEKRPREYGENFEDGESAALTHRFTGQVLRFDRGRGIAWIDFKNRIETGQLVEWLSPKGVRQAKIEAILKEDGTPTHSAHGGLTLGVPVDFDVDEFTLLREPLGSVSPSMHPEDAAVK